jgi:carboxypeptidase family protein
MIPSRPTASVLLSLLALFLMPFLLFVLPGCGGKNAAAPTAATATVSGMVRDASSGTPIQGASVKASSGASGTSGADGRFTINVGSDQRVRIDVTRADYSLNQAVVQLARNQTKTLTVNLIPAGTTTSVDVTAGGMVTDASSNATLLLPAGFVTASGSVHVRVTGLDPTTKQVKALPGGLNAVDANGNAVYLKPVSFAEYTVTDGAGNVLQFNPSASSGANIELPIPASLQGQPGYQNGDPIECYVYDTADGKWKTPVAGVIGPSSVDGQPAIKATIFHLSWYGGAPAAGETGCVQGTVMVDGSPAANVDVEAFPGGSTRTDAQGHYQVQAALDSPVRVDATQMSGSQFRIAEGTVNVGASAAVCATLDLSLGAATDGEYQVAGYLSHLGVTPPSIYDVAVAEITVGVQGSQISATGAVVEIGTDGSTWTTLPETSPGSYELLGGPPTFSLASGELYTMRFDFDHNGTFDASGQVRMSGVPVVTAPGHGATVGSTFTASWTDEGTAIPGYSAVYYGGFYDSTGTRNVFLTSSLSKVVGDGVTDPISGFPNPPLSAGNYQMLLFVATGPPFTASYVPNITGTNASGYLSSFSSADTLSFVCSGVLATSLAPRISATGARASAMPARSSAAVQRVRELYKQRAAAVKRFQQRRLGRPGVVEPLVIRSRTR